MPALAILSISVAGRAAAQSFAATVPTSVVSSIHHREVEQLLFGNWASDTEDCARCVREHH